MFISCPTSQVAKDGEALQWAAATYRGNREIVLAAVQQSWEALEWAPLELRGSAPHRHGHFEKPVLREEFAGFQSSAGLFFKRLFNV